MTSMHNSIWAQTGNTNIIIAPVSWEPATREMPRWTESEFLPVLLTVTCEEGEITILILYMEKSSLREVKSCIRLPDTESARSGISPQQPDCGACTPNCREEGKELTFDHLLCARHWAKLCAWVILVAPNQPVK